MYTLPSDSFSCLDVGTLTSKMDINILINIVTSCGRARLSQDGAASNYRSACIVGKQPLYIVEYGLISHALPMIRHFREYYITIVVPIIHTILQSTLHGSLIMFPDFHI